MKTLSVLIKDCLRCWSVIGCACKSSVVFGWCIVILVRGWGRLFDCVKLSFDSLLKLISDLICQTLQGGVQKSSVSQIFSHWN